MADRLFDKAGTPCFLIIVFRQDLEKTVFDNVMFRATFKKRIGQILACGLAGLVTFGCQTSDISGRDLNQEPLLELSGGFGVSFADSADRLARIGFKPIYEFDDARAYGKLYKLREGSATFFNERLVAVVSPGTGQIMSIEGWRKYAGQPAEKLDEACAGDLRRVEAAVLERYPTFTRQDAVFQMSSRMEPIERTAFYESSKREPDGLHHGPQCQGKSIKVACLRQRADDPKADLVLVVKLEQSSLVLDEFYKEQSAYLIECSGKPME